MEAEELCTICSYPQADHDGVRIVHQFSSSDNPVRLRPRENLPGPPPDNDGDTGVSSTLDHQSGEAHVRIDQGSNRKPLTGDPVLRMILIRKGIITPDDLTQTENELLASGILTNAETVG